MSLSKTSTNTGLPSGIDLARIKATSDFHFDWTLIEPHFTQSPSQPMRIAIASDHRGVHIKAKLVQLLSAAGHQVEDYGTHGDQSVDYPDYAALVSQAVASSAADRGILICGTGIGMAIAANKFPGVRAATCYDEVMAEICRRHNDVNVLCLPGDQRIAKLRNGTRLCCVAKLWRLYPLIHNAGRNSFQQKAIR
jgi:ribose 5-phosphate isomerase B